MWKESYRIGVDLIDKQHMALFKMVGNLLNAVENGTGDNRRECTSAISYLKEYALQHFKDEEEFQRSIRYPGLAEHRQIHHNFVRDVLRHERKMLKSGFSAADVKDFMGMLLAWLVYHVAGADQQIVANKKHATGPKARSPIDDYFHISTCDILNKIAGLDIKRIKVIDKGFSDLQSTIVIQMNLNGDTPGMVTYKYTKQFAFDLIQNISTITPRTLDELVCSAMVEISNYISVRAVSMMSSHGVSYNIDIPIMQVHPAFFPSAESVVFDTGMGVLEMEVAMK